MEKNNEIIAIITERKKYLKDAKLLVKKFLVENHEARKFKQTNWQCDVINNNIEQLNNYSCEIRKNLLDVSLREYAEWNLTLSKRIPSSGNISFAMHDYLQKFRDESYIFQITKYSYNYSILHDLYWITDGYVGEHWAVAKGEAAPDIFDCYCEPLIEKLSTIASQYLKNNTLFAHDALILGDVCAQFSTLSFVSTNILLHSLIESMVRELAKFLYCAQNPGKSLIEACDYVSKFISLETLITKGEWKNDKPIEFADALVKSAYIKDEQLQSTEKLYSEQQTMRRQIAIILESVLGIIQDQSLTNEEIKEKSILKINDAQLIIEKLVDIKTIKIFVSLKVELQFLLRRYKENRNSVVHGNFKNFDKKWYCYVNLSALDKICDLIKFYDSTYHQPAM